MANLICHHKIFCQTDKTNCVQTSEFNFTNFELTQTLILHKENTSTIFSVIRYAPGRECSLDMPSFCAIRKKLVSPTAAFGGRVFLHLLNVLLIFTSITFDEIQK